MPKGGCDVLGLWASEEEKAPRKCGDWRWACLGGEQPWGPREQRGQLSGSPGPLNPGQKVPSRTSRGSQ